MPPPPPLPTPHLFIASLGNPPPKYHNTLHSAGHILLRALSAHLSYPPFTRSRSLAGGLVSEAPSTPAPAPAPAPSTSATYTLWQSPTLMNVSGPTLLNAYKSWLTSASTASASASSGRRKQNTLIILHDELEASLGKLKIRRGGRREYSDRGHRGVRSVLDCLERGGGRVSAVSAKGDGSGAGAGAGAGAGEAMRLVRIGIGIGRPESREKGDVAEYVLREMTGREMRKVEGAVGELVGVLEGEVRL